VREDPLSAQPDRRTLLRLPTFASLAGAQLPADRTIDGKDLLSLLTGESNRSPHDLFCYFNGMQLAAVRRGQWKLFLGRGTGDPLDNRQDDAALYDLESDLGESRDVAPEHPEVVHDLKAAAQRFEAEFARTKRPLGRVPL